MTFKSSKIYLLQMCLYGFFFAQVHSDTTDDNFLQLNNVYPSNFEETVEYYILQALEQSNPYIFFSLEQNYDVDLCDYYFDGDSLISRVVATRWVAGIVYLAINGCFLTIDELGMLESIANQTPNIEDIPLYKILDLYNLSASLFPLSLQAENYVFHLMREASIVRNAHDLDLFNLHLVSYRLLFLQII